MFDKDIDMFDNVNNMFNKASVATFLMSANVKAGI
jgi:hypothetical protein